MIRLDPSWGGGSRGTTRRAVDCWMPPSMTGTMNSAAPWPRSRLRRSPTRSSSASGVPPAALAIRGRGRGERRQGSPPYSGHRAAGRRSDKIRRMADAWPRPSAGPTTSSRPSAGQEAPSSRQLFMPACRPCRAAQERWPHGPDAGIGLIILIIAPLLAIALHRELISLATGTVTGADPRCRFHRRPCRHASR